MTLTSKIQKLQTDAVTARRLADFWQKQIDVHGEVKATAFYKHLGLNHLETKSVEWEGLNLSREPNEIEKLCIKSIAQAQDTGKTNIVDVLLKARRALIDSALIAIKKLTPASYHELILTVPDKSREVLRTEISGIFESGRRLVAKELVSQKSRDVYTVKQSEDEDSELDDLTDLTDSRLANDIQARITAATARFTLLGLTGKELWDAVGKEVGDGSVGWLERIAQGAASRALSLGRLAEMSARSDEIDRYEQSEILDQNTCGPCSADDGTTAFNPDDLPGAPNPDCEGGDWCRGFIVAIAI